MKKTLFLILTLVVSVCFCSCSSKMSHDEVMNIAKPLIEESLELEAVLYGTGLEVGEEKYGKYSKVSSEQYLCTQDIKDALADVYTAELCDIIKNSALKGSTSEYGNTYARYLDVDGVLYMYDEAKVYFVYPRRYDFASIETQSSTDKRIIFTVDTYTAGEDGAYSETPENIEIKLIYDEAYAGWRLDSPTY